MKVHGDREVSERGLGCMGKGRSLRGDEGAWGQGGL